MVLEWILISAVPAIGALILFLALQRWGRKRDPMGGTPGHLWKPDTPRRQPRKERR